MGIISNRPTDVYNIPVMSPELAVGDYKYRLPKDIPIKNITKGRYGIGIEDWSFVKILLEKIN
jgi:hypothetical protein